MSGPKRRIHGGEDNVVARRAFTQLLRIAGVGGDDIAEVGSKNVADEIR